MRGVPKLSGIQATYMPCVYKKALDKYTLGQVSVLAVKVTTMQAAAAAATTIGGALGHIRKRRRLRAYNRQNLSPLT